MELDDQLFRRESGRIVAALTRLFGPHNLALAQDVAQDAFCRALEVWRFRGVPDNPSAWLMTTAKNRALDVLRRERTARTFAPEFGRLLDSEWSLAPAVEGCFANHAINDDMLRMMFSCCDARLAEEAQIALVLNILCGFAVNEIANAFVSSRSAIEKRITRSKKVLAKSSNLFDTSTAADFIARLPAVHRALYLLFNEGYHGACGETAVRRELCREAMRLIALLLEHPLGATPGTYALAALTSLHGARLPGRLDAVGNLNLFEHQDRSQWDRALVLEGLEFLRLSATGAELTEYHLEAAIAAVHAHAERIEDTQWGEIVALYDALMRIRPSPVIALNRAIAIGQMHGSECALKELNSIAGRERLMSYPFYFAALGEFELRRARRDAAREQFQAALDVARNPMEREFLARRVTECAERNA